MCAIRTTHRTWRSSSPPSPRKPIIAVVLIRATPTSAGGIQTNNVATYDRGYIYIVDRADTGLHVLQLEAEAKESIEGGK
jgi:hypothetical protein